MPQLYNFGSYVLYFWVNEGMSPWECAPLYKNDSPYTGGADKYLDKLTGSIIPAIKAEFGAEPGYLNDLNY